MIGFGCHGNHPVITLLRLPNGPKLQYNFCIHLIEDKQNTIPPSFRMPPEILGSLRKSSSLLSVLFFYTGAGIGIYTRWQYHSADLSYLILIIVLALAVFVSLVTYLYGYKDFSRGFSQFWIGVVFSVLSFTEIAYDHLMVSLEDLDLTDILVLASVGIYCFRILMERICNLITYEASCITSEEFLLLLGFVVGSTGTAQFGSILVISLGLAVHLLAFNLKSSFCLLSSIVFCAISGTYFFKAAKQKCNPFCISAFAIQMTFSAILDLYFSKLSLLESWKKIIMQSKCYHRLEILVNMILQGAYFVFCFQGTMIESVSYYRLPVFVLCSVPWIVFHFMFFITSWGFVSKIEECALVLRVQGEISDNNISEIMASKGIRHFCLVSQIVSFYTILSTCLLAASAWQDNNPMFIGFFLIVLPTESIMFDIISKLGKMVGGTATGYALIAPAHKYSRTGDVTILPQEGFQTINNTAMELINIVSRFFATHMIHNFGTDFSSSGIAAEYAEGKIQTFFEQRILPGLSYDTYILYYSGHVHDNGNFALTDGKSLEFSTILKWWRDKNSKTGARLILFLDTAHSDKWLEGIWGITPDFIAIQTGKLQVIYDPEIGNSYPLGELTKMLLEFDSEDSRPVTKKQEKVKPTYGVTRNWCCFKFHKPTVEDIAQHIEDHFPRFMKPVTKLFTHLPCNTNITGVFDWLFDNCRRLKMKWFLPNVFDTGHGFKLVRS